MYKFELSEIVEDFIDSNRDSINELARKYTVNAKTIEIQIRLHLPFFRTEDILRNNNLLETIIEKLVRYITFYACFNKKINNKDIIIPNSKLVGKKDIYIKTTCDEKINIYFKKIDSILIDRIFQEKLHYIKRYRKDTFESFGLFLNNNDKYPLCYASISKCDRTYLLDALRKTNIISEDFNKDILILTRAFSIENAPKNIMSKLFDKIYNYYKAKNNTVIILTALNPFLGFQGSIFKGSSYFQFAKSPMIYSYDNEGLYLNRRSRLNKVTFTQKLSTPNIIWLARGITKEYQKKIENNNLIYNILPNEYNGG